MSDPDKDRLIHALTLACSHLARGWRLGRERPVAEIARLLNDVYGQPVIPASRYGGVEDLRSLGMKPIALGLAPSEIERIRAHFVERRGGKLDDERRYYHPIEDIADAPMLLEIATSDDMLSLAAQYFGTRPTISTLAAWWSVGPQSDLQDQVFHRDGPDIIFCKFFIYLTDVGIEAGPHEFVVGSHNWSHVQKRFKQKIAPKADEASLRTLVDSVFSPRFENLTHYVDAALREDIRTITGPAGTAFLEDTLAIHRARPPVAGRERLLFQVIYALNPDLSYYDFMTGLRGHSAWKARIPKTDLAQHAMRHWLS